MEGKACLRLMVLLLVLSYALSSTSVSAGRSLKSNNQNPPSLQDLLAQDAVEKVSDSEELFGMAENDIEGRMLLESTDYPGTGANNHHDPKTPGRA